MTSRSKRLTTDLKLIDELLVDMRRTGQSWADFEQQSSVAKAAIHRLRTAWSSGEMPAITLSLAKYFDGPEQ